MNPINENGVVVSNLTKDSTPAEVRKAWAERLRNPGDIVQGSGRLAAGNERCCLGVLCDLAVEAGVVPDYNPGDGWPDSSVDAWAALGDAYQTGVTSKYIDSGRHRPGLMELNDSMGFTFADIADLLDDGLVLGPDGEVFEG